MDICIHCTCTRVHVNCINVICHVIMFIFSNGILKINDIITSLQANKIFYMMYYVLSMHGLLNVTLQGDTILFDQFEALPVTLSDIK